MTMYAAVNGPSLLGFLETKEEAARLGTPVKLPVAFERFTRAGRVVTWDGSSFGYDLAAVKNDLWDAIKAERERRIAAAPTDIGTVKADPVSLAYLQARERTVLSGPVDENGNPVGSVGVRLVDNSTVTIPAANLASVLDQASAHVSTVLDASWSIKANVDASTDVTALLKFDVTQGWPA